MIHYHGGPLWPTTAAVQLWTRRHGMTSMAHREQVALMFEVCQSGVLDCGAFTRWKQGDGVVDSAEYYDFILEWFRHPGFDWALIDDEIEGDERANDKRIDGWHRKGMKHGVPVWHLHESLERLRTLARDYDRVALGSSGQWATIGTESWWHRMDEVRDAVCDETGRPITKLHGLRMLSPAVFSRVPLASADSCNVALNIGKDVKWTGTYQPLTEGQRALVLAERIELHAAATTWSKRHAQQQTFSLMG